MEEIDQHIYPVIPGYEIHAELGRGGIATVYLAMQQSLDRRVALKVMSPILAVEPDYAERFVREGRTIAKLNHTNIITVYDIGIQKHKLYIAMEHIPGGNLRDRLDKHKGDADWALAVTGQMALALGYAHRNKVIHRDVKPENILFRENGVAVLTDFGIAKTVSSDTNLTRAGAVVGTPRYMSPEQTDGLGNNPQTDIYSLGIVLFEMLTGKVPYDSENSMAILYAHVHSPIPKLPHGLHDLQPLVDTMLAKKPEDRPADCEHLADVIRMMRRERHNAIKSGEGGSSLVDTLEIPSQADHQEETPASQSQQASKRPYAVQAWLIAAGVAIVLLAALLIWYGDGNEEQVPATTLPHPVDNELEDTDNSDVDVVDDEQLATMTAGQASSKNERIILSEFLSDDEFNTRSKATGKPSQPLVHLRQTEINEYLGKARKALEKGKLHAPKDDNAIHWYQSVLAIDPGNTHAMRGLKAVADLFRERAVTQRRQGNPDLALMQIAQGLEAVPDNPELISLKDEINRSFNANESFSKAERLYHGTGEKKNDRRAAFYYRKAADLGNREAMNALGIMYADGKGLKQNEAKAKYWFRKAADKNDAEAMYNLALGYLFGQDKKLDNALPLATAASSLEYRPAYRLVGWMYTTGTGAPASSFQAFRWDLKGMVNPVGEKLKAQYRNPAGWQKAFEAAYQKATDTGN